MEFNARPAWRYQWRTLLLMVLSLAGALVWTVREPVPRLGETGNLAVVSGLAGLGGLLALVAAYRRYRHGYRIHGGVVEARRGILARRVDALNLSDLRHVEVTQGIWQRLIGVGRIRFASAGTDQPEIVFRGILAPERLRRQLQEHVETPGDAHARGSEGSPGNDGSSREERRFCDQCGETVRASANFCPSCGEALQASSSS